MSQKNLAALLLVFAAALGGPEVYTYVKNDIASEVAEFSAPDQCEIGELVTLTFPGSRVEWICPVEDHFVTDDGTQLRVSFRAKGTYEITVAAIVAGRVQIIKHEIVVGNNNPGPDNSDIDDVPEPSIRNLSDDVYDWCVEYNPPKASCEALGNNFIKAATDATDLDDLLKRTATANRRISQKGCERVLGRIQQYLFDEMQDASFEEHRCVWDEIGMGLLKWSEDGHGQGN